MIFNEIYSVYYNTVAKIISSVLNGTTDEKSLNKIVTENAFGESMLTILPALKSEKWQLIKSDMTTALKHNPTMPLTLIQKQWLKAISLDPRIKLFGETLPDFDDVEPLFTPDDYYIYDKYSDGDPFEDEEYIKRFKIILSAIKGGNAIKMEVLNRNDMPIRMTVRPQRMEYSQKDDKFRLISIGCRYGRIVNLAKVLSVEIVFDEAGARYTYSPPETKTVTIKVKDERNALERAMLHFAHFEKRAEKISDCRYFLHITYNKTHTFNDYVLHRLSSMSANSRRENSKIVGTNGRYI